LVEQRFCKAKVPSSSLGGGSSFVEKDTENPTTASLRSATPKKNITCFSDLRAADFF